MKIEAVIDLDEIWAGEEWDSTIASLIRDELRKVIAKEIKRAVTSDPKLKRAIKAIQDKAAQEIIAAMTDKEA